MRIFSAVLQDSLKILLKIHLDERLTSDRKDHNEENQHSLQTEQ